MSNLNMKHLFATDLLHNSMSDSDLLQTDNSGGIKTINKSHTVADFLHDKRVKANLVHALIQAVGLVDFPQLLVKNLLLGVGKLRAQNPVVEFLCGG